MMVPYCQSVYDILPVYDIQKNQMDFTDSPHVPVTDSPFSPMEIMDAIGELKNSKSGGPCGTPQGLLKVLKDKWIICITMLLNLVLLMPFTPVHWAFSRLIVLFKN